jgi:hypothetical protein
MLMLNHKRTCVAKAANPNWAQTQFKRESKSYSQNLIVLLKYLIEQTQRNPLETNQTEKESQPNSRIVPTKQNMPKKSKLLEITKRKRKGYRPWRPRCGRWRPPPASHGRRGETVPRCVRRDYSVSSTLCPYQTPLMGPFAEPLLLLLSSLPHLPPLLLSLASSSSSFSYASPSPPPPHRTSQVIPGSLSAFPAARPVPSKREREREEVEYRELRV